MFGFHCRFETTQNQKHFTQQEWYIDYPTPPSLRALTIQVDTHSSTCQPQGQPCLGYLSQGRDFLLIMDCFTGPFRDLPMPLSHTKRDLIHTFLTNFILLTLVEWFCVCRFSVSEKERAQEQNCMHTHYYF